MLCCVHTTASAVCCVCNSCVVFVQCIASTVCRAGATISPLIIILFCYFIILLFCVCTCVSSVYCQRSFPCWGYDKSSYYYFILLFLLFCVCTTAIAVCCVCKSCVVFTLLPAQCATYVCKSYVVFALLPVQLQGTVFVSPVLCLHYCQSRVLCV